MSAFGAGPARVAAKGRRAGVLVSALAGAALLACGADPSEELREDIERLEKARVETKAVEKVNAELAEVAARIADAERQLEERSGAVASLERRRDALRAETAAERARLPEIESERKQVQGDAQRALETAAKLDGEIARARARGAFVREQISGLVREIRPSDPEWATQRRLGTLRELMGRYRDEWAKDPALADAAAELVAVGRPEAAPEKAREVAQRIAARLTRIYDLPPHGVPLEPPVAAPSPVDRPKAP